MKNIKYAVLFLLFTAAPILTIDNTPNNIGFGISITYETSSLFELGDIAIKCGPSNSLMVYDSFKKRETALKIVAIKRQTQQLATENEKTTKQIIHIDQQIERLFNKNNKRK